MTYRPPLNKWEDPGNQATRQPIRRFLHHVLPAGYHRVRRFGWLHPVAETRRENVELLLGKTEIASADTAVDPPLDAIDDNWSFFSSSIFTEGAFSPYHLIR